jgi:hypothetical protein
LRASRHASMVRAGAAAVRRKKNVGWVMYRFIVITAAGLSLAGCSSFSMDAFKPAPTTVSVKLDSVPPGADAQTSLGDTCKTPCSVTVPTAGGFSVTYNLAKYQPLTIPVQVTHKAGDLMTAATTTVDPNPVVGQLQPATPPKRPIRKRPRKPRAPKAAAAPQPAAGTPFPQPAAAPAPAPTR